MKESFLVRPGGLRVKLIKKSATSGISGMQHSSVPITSPDHCWNSVSVFLLCLI